MAIEANFNQPRLHNCSNIQLSALVLLRIFIGWHFLYEGISKLLNPYWSSAGYLMESKWILSGIFKSIVASPVILKIVDYLNIIGLVAIGIALIIGFLGRTASISGIALLLLYYLSHPPFGYEYTAPAEGSYIVIDKNLIEMCALFVLTMFPTSKIIGIDRLICRKHRPE